MNKLVGSFFLLTLFIFIGMDGFAQKRTRGIVVDSISLNAIPGIHVRIKNKPGGTTTNSEGVFVLSTSSVDTLVLTFVGYHTLHLPLLFEEEDILIRMTEKVIMLKEVSVTGKRILPSEIIRTKRTLPTAVMEKAQGFSSPIDYFSKWQREKRKLVKFINENDRVKTYVDVVNDQLLRESIMYEHDLTEDAYFDLLAKFNEQNRLLMYSTDPLEIADALEVFFRKNVK